MNKLQVIVFFQLILNIFRQIQLFQQNVLVLPVICSVLFATRFTTILQKENFCLNGGGVVAYVQAQNFEVDSYFFQTSLDYAIICIFTLLFALFSVSRQHQNIFLVSDKIKLYPATFINNPTSIIVITVFISAYGLFFVDDLISLAITWVSLNISLYVLMLRDSIFTAEATLKYFILGAAATGLLFFGIFLHVVEYGSVNYCDFNFLISRNLAYCLPELSLTQGLAATFILISFFFKLGVYPFHFYLGDVYEGVRYETLAVITLPVKFATYFAMLDFVASYGYASVIFQQLFTALGLSSLIIGTYGAFTQQKLRRFWAYSYISSMGFVFLGFQHISTSLSTDVGTHYFLVYLFTWFTIMLFFLTAIMVRRRVYPRFELYEVRYISQLDLFDQIPAWYRVLFHFLLLSLAGVPPTLGFFAKFFVLASCLESSDTYLSLFCILFSLPLGAYNYLRLIKVMSFQIKPYRRVSTEDLRGEHRVVPVLVLLVICTVVVVCLPTFFYLFPLFDVCDLYYTMYGHKGLNLAIFVSYIK